MTEKSVEEPDMGHIAAFEPPTVLALIAAARERDELQARLDKVRSFSEKFAWQWRVEMFPTAFDQGVGVHAQGVLAILDGKDNT